jgi:D-glycero-alpha-D-manno-heptose-7-phosphate kinase
MLITSITPLRVSFLGGGSDYAEFFTENDFGFVFGTTVDLFIYTSAIRNSTLSDHKFKISYRELDECDEINDIRHPVVRAVLNSVGWEGQGLHISTMADVPAGTGLGSSSSFTVGFLKLVHELQGSNALLEEIVTQAINIERNVLNESGGIQDQYHATFGGLSSYQFSLGGTKIETINDDKKTNVLSNSMFLVSVGAPRNSHSEASKWLQTSKSKKLEVENLRSLAMQSFQEFKQASSGENALTILGGGMNESWEIKRRLSNFGSKTTDESMVDYVIRRGKKAGALAGKLCGAGGSGFVLFLVDESAQDRFQKEFKSEVIRKIRVEKSGTRLESYSNWEKKY